LRGDVDRFKRVQKRVTKRLEGSEGIGYKDRLRELGLMTMETKRIRAHLIEIFKISRGMARAVEGMGLVRDEGGRRGHDHKLYINSVRLDVGSLCFVIVCPQWNDLPGEVLGAGSVNGFKRGVD